MTANDAATASPIQTASVASSSSSSSHPPRFNSQLFRANYLRNITLSVITVLIIGLSAIYLYYPRLDACSDPSVRSQVVALLNAKGFKSGIGSSWVGGLSCYADVKGTHKVYLYLPYGALGYYHVVEDDSVNAPNPG